MKSEGAVSPTVITIIILVFGILYLYLKFADRNKKLLCMSCHYVGGMKYEVKGNILIEIILWLAFLVPGIIYTIWRMSNRKKECPLCKSLEIIPIDSPRAKEILSKKSS